MTQQATFLVEIGTEELPPKSLRALAEAFAANFTAELDKANLAHGPVQWFAAPRRLALKVIDLQKSQPDQQIENAALRLPKHLARMVNRPKPLKAGRAVAGSPSTKPSVW